MLTMSVLSTPSLYAVVRRSLPVFAALKGQEKGNISPGRVRDSVFADHSRPVALLRRHEALQLLVEVLDDNDLRRRAGRVNPALLHHQEPLVISGDVVVAKGVAACPPGAVVIHKGRPRSTRRCGVTTKSGPSL